MPTPQLKRRYVGFSTVGNEGIKTLYDSALVEQDLKNVFNTVKGSWLLDPSYGSIIWSLLFEPVTESIKNIIETDTMAIFQAETRVKLISMSIEPSSDPTMPGYTLTAELKYNGSAVASTFQMTFMNGLVDSGL
jgi:phage baseplate assembly protein W